MELRKMANISLHGIARNDRAPHEFRRYAMLMHIEEEDRC
jgi:hypothetical protein